MIFWTFSLLIAVILSSSEHSSDDFSYFNGKARRHKLGKARMKGIKDFSSEFYDSSDSNDEELSPMEIRKRCNVKEVDIKEGIEYEVEFNIGLMDEWMSDKNKGKKRHGNNNENSKENDSDEIRRLHALGSDDRFENLGSPPTSTLSEYVGRLTYKKANGLTYQCTATLIDYNWVLTAGHCLHEGKGGQWFSNFLWYPRQTSRFTPAAISINYIAAFNGWLNNGDLKYDMGWARLSVFPGLGYACWGYTNLLTTRTFVYIWGYPSDKPIGSMWATYDYISKLSTEYFETDSSDAFGGMSGGPVHSYGSQHPWAPTNWCIDGVHKGNWINAPTHHIHTRLTAAKYNTICQYTTYSC